MSIYPLFGGVGLLTSPTKPNKLLVWDTFAGFDGTVLTSHPPDINTNGTGWLHAEYASGSAGDTAGLLSAGQLQILNDSVGNIIACGQSNVVITVDWTPAASSLNRNSVLGRYSGAGDMILMNIREDNGDINLIDRFSASEITMQNVSYGWVEGTTYAIKLVLNGTTIQGYVNGVLVVSGTSSHNTTNTKHGLLRNAGSNNTRFDNFRIEKV